MLILEKLPFHLMLVYMFMGHEADFLDPGNLVPSDLTLMSASLNLNMSLSSTSRFISGNYNREDRVPFSEWEKNAKELTRALALRPKDNPPQLLKTWVSMLFLAFEPCKSAQGSVSAW